MRVGTLALAVLCSTACGGRSGTADDLERAYRANNLGVALLEQFQYTEAAARFQDALEIEPSLAIARVNLSIALFYEQDLAGAVREAAAAVKELPSAPQPLYVLGLAARAENRTQDAVRWFELVRARDPGDAATNINLGQIYLEEGRYLDAIEILRPVVTDEPYHVTAAYVLGLALARIGETAEGERLLDRVQALRTTAYATTLGTSYLEQGRYGEAIASTGAEPGLVDRAVSEARFSPVAIAAGLPLADPPASPFGRRFTAEDLAGEGPRGLAAGLAGSVTPIDIEPDGDLDLFVGTSDGERLWRLGPGADWSDATEGSGLGGPPGAVALGAVAADFDNDGRTDLFVLRHGGSSLYRNLGDGRFADVTADAGLPAYPFLPGAAAFADVDHDGDLDLVIGGLADLVATARLDVAGGARFPDEFAPAPLQLLRNNRDGTFTDVTNAARLDAVGHVVAIAPTDFDNRRDLDLLVAGADGLRLYRNLRDGTFADVAAEVGLDAVNDGGDTISAVSTADVNGDDYPDFFFARVDGGVLALSDGRGRLTLEPAPEAARSALAAQFVDYDGDGLIDLYAWTAGGLRVVRNEGGGWRDVTASAVTGGADWRPPGSARAVAAADMDGDGKSDLVTVVGGQLTLWRNSGDTRHQSVSLSLQGLASNRSGVGAKVQLRAGSLRARVETSAATPAVAPADVLFGLGARPGADVVRVLWPSGILQAEAAGAAPPGEPSFLRSPLAIQELDRKPSSCPYLYTWNGERFEFVTDFLGGGEMGYWTAPGLYNRPDPVEYVRIRGDQLRPRDGRLALRVTNELEEALFVDELELIAIAHPSNLGVYPNEGMTDPPKPFRLHGVGNARVPVRAFDDHGHDVTERIARVDGRAPDDFALAPLRGYAERHTLTLDIGVASGPVTLLLTGWTDYAFSSDNVAAHQAGLTPMPPLLEIRGLDGTWRAAGVDVGIAVGRPQTIAVDLARRLRPGERELRIVTNMRAYWDQILIGATASTGELILRNVPAWSATLRARGYAAEIRPGGRGPISYDYDRVTFRAPWKAMVGAYTREGDVLELLEHADDMFVIAKTGDEIALEFDTTALEPLLDGWTYTYLLRADGYSKEMDINSATPDTVEPLPFHGMTQYPYGSIEHYPDTPEHRRYRETYNTRVVVRPVPSIDLASLP